MKRKISKNKYSSLKYVYPSIWVTLVKSKSFGRAILLIIKLFEEMCQLFLYSIIHLVFTYEQTNKIITKLFFKSIKVIDNILLLRNIRKPNLFIYFVRTSYVKAEAVREPISRAQLAKSPLLDK